ncbi:homolog of DNA mismatch repair protein MSH3 isoform X2 [Tasmannia lanceolata]|uniref:homolog of DNA mismatch repair protein MSH3 isoform X2 n=1 Tax=Tasmannia lanceolata TaxID=3420 RepID=UPI004062C1CF
MGKQKQQTISRFFAPKHQNPNSQTFDFPNNIPSPPPKISATVSFSPSKRKTLTLTPTSPPSKKPKTLTLPPPPKTLTLNPPPPKTLTPTPPNPSLHQKFLKKLLEPSTSTPPPTPTSQNPKFTPLEQQVVELKSKYPDVLLMIEVGYKFRFFGEDAETAARVLGIFAHIDHNFLTASIPTFRLHFHVRRLVSAGYKVGVVKQTETAAIKAHGSNRIGPFSRGLSALYTKATIEAAEDMLGGGGEGEDCGGFGSNYLVCVVEKSFPVENRDCGVEGNFDVKLGLVGVEISTGEVMYGEFNDNVMRAGLESVILSLSPAEILIGEPLSTQTEKFLLAYAGPSSNVRVERTSRDCFNDGGALAEVMTLYEELGEDTAIVEHPEQSPETTKAGKHFGIEGIMAMPELAVQALALTIRHLKHFGYERILCLGASFRPFSSNIEMSLSANALQQLEILKNNSDGSESGSLLRAMNHTCTAFGSRLLRHWVTHPLCDRNSICARLDAVSEIAESMGPYNAPGNVFEHGKEVSCGPELGCLLSSVLTTLGRSPDVQRGVTRIFHRTATAAEFIVVIHAILSAGKQLKQLHLEDRDYNGKVQEKTVRSSLFRRLILTASSDTVTGDAAKLLSSLNKEAANQGDLQDLFIISNGQFPEVGRARTVVQIAKEKVDLLIGLYRKQLGVRNLEFMSVSGSTHLIELPSDVRVPSNWVKVNSTKKTIRYHTPEVLKALDGLLLAKEELSVACRSTWDSFLMGFGRYYAEFQAAVQALAALDCLRSLAILSRNQNYVRPVFVDDDEPCQLHIHSGRHPVGSFVPASSAKLHVLDGVYTRMGSSDSIQQGRSTFFEELSEASHILRNCSPHSLVIIDELGRGTSTHDGVAIAYATLHHLLKEKKCMVLFVTHYPKIVDIKDEFPRAVGAYHVSYLTSQNVLEITDSKSDHSVESVDHGDVTFLYKVVPGISDKSFGLNVARLAQLPSSCVARAAVMATKLEAEVSTRVETQLARKHLLETPVCLEENQTQENCSNSNEFSCREQLGNSLCDRIVGFEELAGTYRELFVYLQSAFTDADPVDRLCSLKDARRLAIKMITSEGLAVAEK